MKANFRKGLTEEVAFALGYDNNATLHKRVEIEVCDLCHGFGANKQLDGELYGKVNCGRCYGSGRIRKVTFIVTAPYKPEEVVKDELTV